MLYGLVHIPLFSPKVMRTLKSAIVMQKPKVGCPLRSTKAKDQHSHIDETFCEDSTLTESL